MRRASPPSAWAAPKRAGAPRAVVEFIKANTPAQCRVAAVDLGATSGRVMAVTVGPGVLDAVEVHRFADPTVLVPKPNGGGTLTIDILAIWAEIFAGLRQMALGGPINSIGIDSWAVDYGLLDADGALLANPTSYRDSRTNNIPEQLLATNDISFLELYQRTGIQFLPFNTIFQLAAEQQANPARLTNAQTLLMLPDLFNYWLTGNRVTEITNASSTSLVNPVTRDWDFDLICNLDFPPRIFTAIIEPGTLVGDTRALELSADSERPVPVIAVASHDTASAVVAVPMEHPEISAYISSGTWSLVGLELAEPILTDQAREINATNELGMDGTVRFLRNTMGLWLLSGCQEQWQAEGKDASLPYLLAQAESAPGFQWVIDAESNEFIAPGNMADRITNAAISAGGVSTSKPQNQGEIVRCILDSLALAYAKSVRELAAAANRKVEVIHIVGGGALNTLLCQLTADACGVEVIAGPVEAAALGNALVQARALGVIQGGLPELRHLVRQTQPLTSYYPVGQMAPQWATYAGYLTQAN